MATRRQRRKKGKKLSQNDDPPADASSRSIARDGDGTASTTATGTTWERLAGPSGSAPPAVLLVIAFVALPAALGQLLMPLLGPARLVLEPLDREIRVAAPSLLAVGVAAFFATHRLVQRLVVPERLATLFYLGAALTTLSWGFQIPSYLNAALDRDPGYIQSLNGSKIVGTSVFVTTDLKPGVALLRRTFAQGCRDAALGARCRFTVRAGRLGLQWAQPNPDEGK